MDFSLNYTQLVTCVFGRFCQVTAAVAFGSYLRLTSWNPQADIKQDNIIDIFDPVTIAINFGKTF